jgi:hypothetical protein
MVAWHKEKLFESAQKPPNVIVSIFPTPGNDISQNRKKI